MGRQPVQTDDAGYTLDTFTRLDCKYPYHWWPSVASTANNAFHCSLEGLDHIRRCMDLGDMKGLWVDPEQMAWFAGVGYGPVFTRMRARCREDNREAWPWTRVRESVKMHFEGFLPDLMTELLWVPPETGRQFIGQSVMAFKECRERGFIRGEFHLLRGWIPSRCRGKINTVYLPDVIKRKQIVTLRRLFGNRFGTAKLDVLRDIPPLTLMRIKAGRMLPSEWSEEWERDNPSAKKSG